MPGPASLFFGLVFSAIGTGYCIYGKRQSMFVPMLCGIAMIAYAWFIASVLWLIVIGLVLAAIPWFIRY